MSARYVCRLRQQARTFCTSVLFFCRVRFCVFVSGGSPHGLFQSLPPVFLYTTSRGRVKNMNCQVVLFFHTRLTAPLRAQSWICSQPCLASNDSGNTLNVPLLLMFVAINAERRKRASESSKHCHLATRTCSYNVGASELLCQNQHLHAPVRNPTNCKVDTCNAAGHALVISRCSKRVTDCALV